MEQDRHDKARAELHILEAVAQAIERREEVFSAIEAAQTQDKARTALAKLLGMDEIQAYAVLDMQARRWMQGEQRKVVERIAVLRSELEPT